MKAKNLAIGFLAILLAVAVAPLTTAKSTSEESFSAPVVLPTDGNWSYIQNDFITIAFPADGKKPMFLWWYTNDPNNINVAKFKGLVEYSTFEKPYFLWRCQAENWRIRERLHTRFYVPKQHMLGGMMKSRAMEKLWKIGNFTGLHASYLPFSSSKWRLDGPENVTRGDVKYLSFNFTLVDVPGRREQFQFAEDNIIIRCRFYYTPTTEDVYGEYAYTVDTGELKIDLIIKHWEWNIDKLEPTIQELRDIGLDIPKSKASLALWVNLASINMTKLEVAEEDAESTADLDFTERTSTAQNMYVEGDKVSVVQDRAEIDEEIPLRNQLKEHFKVRFEKGNTTFEGFFKFVPQAIVTDGITYNTTDVTASYISAGAHMRLFIGYPYFGNYTLEHDPSLGAEGVSPWLPTNLLLILVGVTVLIAVAVAAVKVRKKTVNIISVQ